MQDRIQIAKFTVLTLSLSKNGNISCDLLQEEKCVVSHEYYYTSNAKINNIHLKK